MIGSIVLKKKIANGFQFLMQGNLTDFFKVWSDHASLIYAGDASVSGEFHGKPEVEKWFENFVYQFPSREFVIKNICLENSFAVTANNVAMVEWEVDLENREGKKYHNFGVSVFVIKNGKVESEKIYLRFTHTLKEGWGEL